MVEFKLTSRGRSGFLNPQTKAALDSIPPAGYKSPQVLIGFKTIDPAIIALRVKNYNRAYKTLSASVWNSYVAFGIQDYASPTEYQMAIANESSDTKHLRVARYYRKLLENRAKIDGFLLQSMPEVENALAISHPGFFDMSLKDMDLYLNQSDTIADDPMDTTETAPPASSLAAAAKPNESAVAVAMQSTPEPFLGIPDVLPMENSLPLTQADENGFTPVKAPKPVKKKGHQKRPSDDATVSLPVDIAPCATPLAPPVAQHPPTPKETTPNLNVKRPKRIKNVLRVEARWAPKDFNELRSSSKKMHLRLAPILSCFNTQYTWMMEWQTDQMDVAADIDPAQMSKYLSIRVASVAKDQCFYFSFRIHGSGPQFTQVALSKVLSTAKRGENMQFDPSFIPPSQGELTYVGDILLKDASVTHRGQYLQYLRQEVLPPETPLFDLKLRHSNPTGSNITILTVRCGKSTSTKTAEILSNALCGEGQHPEIFISRLGLGASQTSKQNHERIYTVHNEYLDDVAHLLFSASASIDTVVTEFFDSGETILRTPRQWAKSLVSPDGNSLEADLENGGAHAGRAVLVVPSASLSIAKNELMAYWTRRNPTLSHAAKLYRDSVNTHPDIPKTVFTKNIDTILSKKIKKNTEPPRGDDSSLSTPISSITGGATENTSSKGSIAWRKPLQDTLLSKVKPAKASSKFSSVELNQKKKIAILEAQLALLSTTHGTPSIASQASHSSTSQASKSGKTKSSRSSTQSGLTASSAHSRMDKYEASLLDHRTTLEDQKESLDEIKAMLKAMTLSTSSAPIPAAAAAAPILLQDDPLWAKSAKDTCHLSTPGGNRMNDAAPLPEMLGGTALTILSTPTRKSSKKRRNPASPTKSPTSNSSLQYNNHTDSSGGDSC